MITGLAGPRALTDHGLSHVGLLCSGIHETRAELETRDVSFLADGIADVARPRTTWFEDPWGTVFLLMEKSRGTRHSVAQWG